MKRVHLPLQVLAQDPHIDQEVQTELNLTETQIWTCLKSHFVWYINIYNPYEN